jgi:hypothetical protein
VPALQRTVSSAQPVRTSSWIPFLSWLDGGIRVGLFAYGAVHLLIGWLALQLAFGDRTEHASSTGALQELARQPLGEVLVSAIAAGMGILVVWRLLEVVVGHRDKRPGAHRWRARAVSSFKAGVYGAICGTAVSVLIGATSSAGGSSWTRTVKEWPGGRWIIAAVGLTALVYGANHVRRGLTEAYGKHLSGEGRSGDAGRAYLLFGKLGYSGKGMAIGIVGGLILVGDLTRHHARYDDLDHALRTLLRYHFGQGLLVLIAAGFICFGVFCFARARHLSRSDLRATESGLRSID